MSYRPPDTVTRGWPYPAVECYGKPHVGCSYGGRSVNSHRLVDDATCAVCGRMATNAHHWPPKGTCPTFRHRGKELRPALIALCGSGTTGCHGDWHKGRYKALWRWDSDEYAEAWWEGTLLDELGAHSRALYLFGCWEFYDVRGARIWTFRG